MYVKDDPSIKRPSTTSSTGMLSGAPGSAPRFRTPPGAMEAAGASRAGGVSSLLMQTAGKRWGHAFFRA